MWVKKVFLVVIGIVILAVGWHIFTRQDSMSNTPGTQAQFDKKQHSIDAADSTWLVVNKTRPLNPPDYKPANLVAPGIPLRLSTADEEMLMRADAARALGQLNAGVKAETGLEIMLASAYRSYGFQRGLYNRYVSEQGQETADQQSARPGYSEHQTGLAADVEPTSRECEVEDCFADTKEGKWVAANAYKYGFVIRYPENRQRTTGYIYEPWHLRYVGADLATAVHEAGDPTLEEFFGLPAAPDYQ
jgi:D-alanyl-D-alanine carboxypeptidase